MLDGLLGRSFAAKCKSLIKQTKSRIDVIRRKRSATLKFLKKDVADLLANGLEINAYGRAEGLVAELILTSCYDFVERCCDLVLKHLTVLQKMRHCPEDCRDAVSSIMFAAARFSDLVELRDLRNLFLERYGDSLELYVNQGFVDNLSVKPVSTEKKVQLLQDVASEFNIRWDSRGFEQRMSRPAPVQDQPRTYGSSLANGNNSGLTNGKDNNSQGVKRDFPSKERQVQKNHGFGLANEDKNVWKRDELNPRSRNEGANHVNKLQIGGEKETTLRNNKYELLSPPSRQEVHVVKKNELTKDNTPLKTVGSVVSSQRKQHAYVDAGSKLHDDKPSKPYKPVRMDDAIHGKPEASPSYAGIQSKDNRRDPLAGNVYAGSKQPTEKSTSDAQEREAHKSLSFYKNAIPPPYTRPNSKLKDSKSPVNVASANTVSDTDAVNDTPSAQKINHGYRSENNDPRSHRPDRVAPGAGTPARGDSEHVFDTKVYYQGDTTVMNPIPKPRSARRRHPKPQTSQDNNVRNVESAGVVKRKSRSRRKEDSRRGLQILFDDEQQKSDEEERIIDKLLVHYSKKPSTYEPEPGKSIRRKPSSSSSNHHAHQPSAGTAAPHSKSPTHIGREDDGESSASGRSHPSRSVSLPSDQPSSSVQPPPANKVFTRAATLEPDRAARHVHPKLPDYDDLAARFAALKGR